MYNVQADSASVHMAMRILGVAITESALIQYSYARKPTKWTTRMSVITWMMYAIYNVAMVLLPGRLDDVIDDTEKQIRALKEPTENAVTCSTW